MFKCKEDLDQVADNVSLGNNYVLLFAEKNLAFQVPEVAVFENYYHLVVYLVDKALHTADDVWVLKF